MNAPGFVLRERRTNEPFAVGKLALELIRLQIGRDIQDLEAKDLFAVSERQRHRVLRGMYSHWMESRIPFMLPRMIHHILRRPHGGFPACSSKQARNVTSQHRCQTARTTTLFAPGRCTHHTSWTKSITASDRGCLRLCLKQRLFDGAIGTAKTYILNSFDHITPELMHPSLVILYLLWDGKASHQFASENSTFCDRVDGFELALATP